MLDLGAVKRQIDQMAQEQKESQQRFLDRVDAAVAELQRWETGWEDLDAKITRGHPPWLVARGLSGPPGATFLPPERPKQVTVIATDGSQIFPDRHEVASCFLINIGSAVIHYGTGERPQLTSRPLLFYRDRDLFPQWAGRRMLMNNELLALKRGALEITELAALAERVTEAGKRVVALVDGTLILWMLDGCPSDFKKEALEPYLAAFHRFRQARVPVGGYISDPGSADLVNALRVGLCPEETPDCQRCPCQCGVDARQLHIGPCEQIAGVTDALLLTRQLGRNERSGVFRSSSRILEEYGEHAVSFFYINVGQEFVRIEIPAWVAENRDMVGLIHSCVCDQTEKGRGYPVVLSEAHEKAVVRGSDRELFYRFLRDAFVKCDLSVSISSKAVRKLGPGV
ncbi:MAG: DNA double-strand break repair nuclease NurA [Candidatus Latescibacteria bacterium]|nr:DNA double-strand break repair nuclease NurA [Candidatus Latescibacterota bacterium]